MKHAFALVCLAMSVPLAVGCGPADPEGEDVEGQAEDGLRGGIPVGSTLETTADTQLLSAPRRRASSLAFVPAHSQVQALEASPTNGYYHVDYQGTAGWIRGSLLQRVTMAETQASPLPPSPTNSGASTSPST